MNKIQSFVQRRRRAITAFLLVCLGLIMCVIILGFVPFSSAALKNKVEGLLKESLNGQCTIDKLNITLWKGIVLSDVQYRYNDQRKSQLRLLCTFPRITVSYFLIPVIFKHLIINKISFENPIVSIECPDPAVLRETPPEVVSIAAIKRVIATLPYTVLVRSFSITNAQVTYLKDKSVLAGGKGVELSLTIGLDHGLVLNGRLSASDLTIMDNYRFTGCKASIRIKGTEVFLQDCRASFYGGALSIKGAVDLTGNTVNSLLVSLTDLKLEEWYRAQGQGKGELSGTMNAFMALDKSKFAVDSLRGKGWVKATAVSTHGTSLQKNLVLRLIIPKLETLKFSKIYSDLVVKNGAIYTGNFYGKGDPVDFKADGLIKMNGQLSERIEGVFSADFSNGLPDIVRNSLLPVEGNKEKRAFKCSIQGTVDNPHLEIDQRIVNRAVNNVFEAIGKSIGNLFKK
jgi:hypothetical protein